MPLFQHANAYRIESSASGRSTCRACKKNISKGALRVRTIARVKPGRSACFFRHASCVSSAFAKAVLSAYARAESIPREPGLDAKGVALVLDAIRDASAKKGV